MLEAPEPLFLQVVTIIWDEFPQQSLKKKGGGEKKSSLISLNVKLLFSALSFRPSPPQLRKKRSFKVFLSYSLACGRETGAG